MKSISFKRLIAFAWVMSFSFFSFAQNSSGNLDPVIVRGIETSAQLSDFLNSKSVIERIDIEKMQVGDLYDLLQGQAGLDMARSGGVGSQISIYSRGSSSSQTLILIDGIPFGGQDATGSASPLQNIPIQLIEKIAITRGNASAQYGPGAMGGVIEITTRTGSNGVPMPYSEISYGSQNTRSLLVGYGGKVNDTQFNFSINQNNSNGIGTISATKFPNYPSFNLFGNPVVNGVNPSNNPYSNQGLSLSLRQNMDALTYVDFKFLKSNLASSFDNYYDSPEFNWKNKTGSEFTKISVVRQINEEWISNLNYSRSQTNLSTLKNNLPDGMYGSTDTRHNTLKWTNDLSVNKNSDLNFGYERKISNLKAAHDSVAYDIFFNPSFVPFELDKKINNQRIYSGVNYRYEKLSSQFSLSQNRETGFTNKTNYFYGLGYQLTGEFKTFANQSTAVLYPTVGQLYDSSYGGAIDLKPENSLSREFGIQYKDRLNFFRVVAFKVNYDNLIGSTSQFVDDLFWGDPLTGGQGVKKYGNEQRAHNSGVEIEWKRDSGRFQSGISITHQNPVNDSGNVKVLNKSRNFGSVNLVYSLDGKNKLNAKIFGIGDRYTPNMHPTNFDPVKVAGYALLKFGWQHQIDNTWSTSLTLDNALNKQYYQVYGYNNAPRSIFANLRYIPK